MKTKRLTSKRLLIGLAAVAVFSVVMVPVYLLLIAPTFVGKTGTDGAMLRKYVEPAALKRLVDDPDDTIWIVDVRPRFLYERGHIPTARSFPSGEIDSRLAEIPKDKYLILYCETGGRVLPVMRALEKNGYTRYMNWGGFGRWEYEPAVE